MKKFLSCVLAMALVFSLMSVTVFAGDAKLPVAGAGQYDVIGTQGDTTDTSISYQDGVTDFDNKTVGADVGVNFGTTTTTDPDSGETTTTVNTNNVIEHRYAIDILYKELVFDLTKLTPTEVIPDPENPEETVERTYKFVWDVTQHTYVMVEVIDGVPGEVVDPNDQTNDALTDAEVTIEGAFQVINHSDLVVNYSAAIAVSNDYASVLDLSIGTKGTVNVPTTEIRACVATMVDDDGDPLTAPTWEAGTEQPGTAHTIIATPDADWATTISALAVAGVAGTAQVTVGSITITVTK